MTSNRGIRRRPDPNAWSAACTPPLQPLGGAQFRISRPEKACSKRLIDDRVLLPSIEEDHHDNEEGCTAQLKREDLLAKAVWRRQREQESNRERESRLCECRK